MMDYTSGCTVLPSSQQHGYISLEMSLVVRDCCGSHLALQSCGAMAGSLLDGRWVCG